MVLNVADAFVCDEYQGPNANVSFKPILRHSPYNGILYQKLVVLLTYEDCQYDNFRDYQCGQAMVNCRRLFVFEVFWVEAKHWNHLVDPGDSHVQEVLSVGQICFMDIGLEFMPDKV